MVVIVNLLDHMADPAVLDDSIGDVSIDQFRLYGYKSSLEGRAAEIQELITDAEIVRTIDGAPTLEITCIDADRRLSEFNFLSYRITAILDRFAYELVQVTKAGDLFILTFEEVIVAEMRRSTKPRKIAAGLMSRVEFGYYLLAEVPPVDFVTPPITLEVTRNELARGKEKLTPGQDPEDTWECLTRIFGEVRWRFWVDGGRVFAAPDAYLVALPVAARITERTGAVGDIDYDVDNGKLVNKVEIQVLSRRWGLPIGSRIDIMGVGPEAGAWVVSEIRRSLFSPTAQVTGIRPQLELPEPPHQPTEGEMGGSTPPQNLQVPGAPGSGPRSHGTVEQVVQFALSKEGGPYVWGGTGPVGYDCSGLVQDAFAQVDVRLPRVSNAQYDFCEGAGQAITVEEAAVTRGAILERSPYVRGDTGHIAISLGTGNETIEAMGPAYGITRGKIHGRLFNHGARVPGVTYG